MDHKQTISRPGSSILARRERISPAIYEPLATPSLGFVSASILVRKDLRVWITPCVPLLGEQFSVASEPFCRVLEPLVGWIVTVPGEFKPSWPRQTQGIVTLCVGQLTLPLTALVPSPNHIGIPMQTVVELDTVELRRPRRLCQCLNNPSKLSGLYMPNHDY